MSYVFLPATEEELLFSHWWGRYVTDLTDEQFRTGAATSTVLRAAESAWKASARAPRGHEAPRKPAE